MRFKKGDLVCLTDAALGKEGLGNKDYVPNPITKRLLQGDAIEVFDIVPAVHGSELSSVRFEGGSYSLSPGHFELATTNKRKIPFKIRIVRFLWAADRHLFGV
jgi:hypothetical protein